MLKWYDANARVLPWRVGPKARAAGKRPDPYAVWLSEIMLQQTTVATVTPRYAAFLERWPTVHHMAAAPAEDIYSQWAGLGYYARARNLHKCAIDIVELHDGEFPQTEERLRSLPGIGDYTAAAIAAIAFDQSAVVMDGNIERVGARLFAISSPLPKAKPEIKEAVASIWPKKRSGDFAQGLMDLGAMVCTPRNSDCEACPLRRDCKALAQGLQNDLPKKAKKTVKPTRYGAAFVLVNGRGEVLFERRPEKGLLGGMLCLPGTPWTEEMPALDAPEKQKWRRVGEARHTFTHFHLKLDVHEGTTRRKANDGEIWIKPSEARLPTVMRKALDVALKQEGTE